MPKVHFVKKARKAIKSHGIKKGQPYYWWSFRFGGKRVSKTPPRASQLTQSKMSGVLAAEEAVQDMLELAMKGFRSLDDLAGEIGVAMDSVQEVADEYSDSADNMESAFPNGSPKIDELREKSDAVSSLADEIRHVTDDLSVDTAALEAAAIALLPENPALGACRKCHRKRTFVKKINGGYGGWRDGPRVPCKCCAGLSVLVSVHSEHKLTRSADGVRGRVTKKITTVWVKEERVVETMLAGRKKIKEWVAYTPVDYVRRERDAGRIPPLVLSTEDAEKLESITREMESLDWSCGL